MLQRSGRAVFHLMLAANVLLAGMVPPAVRHNHQGGSDLSHHHDDLDCVGDHDDDHAAGDHDQGLLTDESHFHVGWLGVAVTLTDRAPGGPAEANASGPWGGWLFLRDGCGGRLTPPAGLVIGGGLPALHHPPWPGDTVALISVLPGSRPALVLRLLCDRARHERSGVLLA